MQFLETRFYEVSSWFQKLSICKSVFFEELYKNQIDSSLYHSFSKETTFQTNKNPHFIVSPRDKNDNGHIQPCYIYTFSQTTCFQKQFKAMRMQQYNLLVVFIFIPIFTFEKTRLQRCIRKHMVRNCILFTIYNTPK